jgi:hypothetical protein
MNTYTLSGDTARRMMRMLKWWEQQPHGGPDGSIELPGGRNKQLVQVTGGTAFEVPDFWYYGAQVATWDAANAEFTLGGDCYLVADIDTPLQLGKYYLASQTGNTSDTPTFVTTQSCCTDPTPPPVACQVGTQLCVCVSNVSIYYKFLFGGVPTPAEMFIPANLIFSYTGPDCQTLTLAGAPPSDTINFTNQAITYPSIPFGPHNGNVGGLVTLSCDNADPNGAVSLVFQYGIIELGHATYINGSFPSLSSILGTTTYQSIIVGQGISNFYGYIFDFSIEEGPC